MRFAVMGGYGNMGSAVVGDLFDSYPECEIIVAGRDGKKAKELADSFKSKRVKSAAADIGDKKSAFRVLKDCDVCINCVQYYFNVQIMEACVLAKTNYVDLGGMYHTTLKQLKLDREFKKIGKVAVVGCGSSPGITNVMAKHAASRSGKVDEMHVSFGDADFTKYNQPFVLPYSMQTLFDEFSMKPAVLRKGKIVFVNPGEGRKAIKFPDPVGELEGFYSLHSELATLPRSFGLSECTFRITFPKDFVEKVRFLIDAGFASGKEVDIGGKKVSPREFTAKIMDQWVPKDVKVNDLEYLRVEAIGDKKVVVYCLTKSDRKRNVPAGVYDTAVAPCAAAYLISKGLALGSGVLPPENAFSPEDFFAELAKRKIFVFEGNKKIN
jgi:lysine 6-dehydrogenase